jgi:flagellar biosynthesis protein FliP
MMDKVFGLAGLIFTSGVLVGLIMAIYIIKPYFREMYIKSMKECEREIIRLREKIKKQIGELEK